MRICLNMEDFQKLSTAAKEEILGIFSGRAANTKTMPEEVTESSADLTPFMMKKFMEGVSSTTKDLLRVFAENNGRASYAQLLSRSGYSDIRKLSGFQAGVTRRVRGILQDDEAFLFEWDEDSAELDENQKTINGDFVMTKLTTESLKKYYSI